MTRPLLLTGATGFLGGEVARQARAAGRDVVAVARATSDRAGAAPHVEAWVEAELADAGSVERAFAQARALAGGPLDCVHCAALISYRSADAEAQQRVNVEGTQNVLAAARRHDVGRLVHVSSVVAVGETSADGLLDEDAPWRGDRLRVDYVRTKRAAEELALGAQADVVVVNPGAIFGPASERSNSAHFLRELTAGRVLVAPPGSLTALGVEDCARGVLLALERGASGRRYLLTDRVLRYAELCALVARRAGARPPLMTVPGPVWTAVSAGARAVDALAPMQRLTPQSLRMTGAHYRFDSSRARRELAWTTRPFEEVLSDALEAMGLVPPRDQASATS